MLEIKAFGDDCGGEYGEPLGKSVDRMSSTQTAVLSVGHLYDLYASAPATGALSPFPGVSPAHFGNCCY